MLAELAITITCHITGTPPMLAPDNALACTPGSYTALTRAEACTHKDRPYLPARDRRTILTHYDVPGWTGKDGELDHRVPFYLGGNTNPANLWPEAGPIPNAKDKLEAFTYTRVCRTRDMRVRTAVRLFLADWRHAYRAYHCTTRCRP